MIIKPTITTIKEKEHSSVVVCFIFISPLIENEQRGITYPRPPVMQQESVVIRPHPPPATFFLRSTGQRSKTVGISAYEQKYPPNS